MTTCTPSNLYNPTTNQCCPSGQPYNSATLNCGPTVPAGPKKLTTCTPSNLYNPGTNQCCPSGQPYNSATLNCGPTSPQYISPPAYTQLNMQNDLYSFYSIDAGGEFNDVCNYIGPSGQSIIGAMGNTGPTFCVVPPNQAVNICNNMGPYSYNSATKQSSGCSGYLQPPTSASTTGQYWAPFAGQVQLIQNPPIARLLPQMGGITYYTQPPYIVNPISANNNTWKNNDPPFTQLALGCTGSAELFNSGPGTTSYTLPGSYPTTQTIIAPPNGIIAPSTGISISAGTAIPAGTVIPAAAVFPVGTIFNPNAFKLLNMTSNVNSTNFTLTQSYTTPAAITVPINGITIPPLTISPGSAIPAGTVILAGTVFPVGTIINESAIPYCILPKIAAINYCNTWNHNNPQPGTECNGYFSTTSQGWPFPNQVQLIQNPPSQMVSTDNINLAYYSSPLAQQILSRGGSPALRPMN